MKIALAQPNPGIGDFEKNCKKILHYVQQAADSGCKLILFPELVLTGYPPQDLLQRPSFLAAQNAALSLLQQEITKIDGQIDVLLGCCEKNDSSGKSLFNSAVVLRGGEIAHRSRKKRLPSCGVVDERRYFECGGKSSLYHNGDAVFGVTIGYDLLADEALSADNLVADLLTQAKEAGVQLTGIINIAASPFLLESWQQRQKNFTELCKKSGLPLLFCNQVGGQDNLIFDGGSMVISGQGEVVAAARSFVEDMIIFDTAGTQQTCSSSTQKDEVAAIRDALVLGLHDYLHKTGFSKAVLGLSGGIDSALTAALAVEALGAENVLGVALPSPYSSKESVEDARQLAQNLGCHFEVLPIGDLFDQYNNSLSPLFADYAEDVTEQNLQARTRGTLLMALSNKFGSMLLNTGNKSELAVGYCTLYGDMCGGLAVIADLPKRLVYKVAEYINASSTTGERIPQRTITKAPSAELKPGQKDQDELPPYDILDQIIDLYLDENCGLEEIVAKGFQQEVVADVLRRIRINEYKRKQAPVGLKITANSFDGGRHYPIAQNFRG